MSDLNCMNCRIGRFKEELCDCDGEFCKKFKGVGCGNDFINAVMASEPKQRWIYCEERLPEDLTNVLVWTKDADVGTAFFLKLDDDESGFVKTSPTEGEVIAWMPSPDPPKGADDE